jgi:hypothetical protein
VQIRFRNNGGKAVLRAEAHLVYRTTAEDSAKVTFAWKDDSGAHQSDHLFPAAAGAPATWQLTTGKGVKTQWVEYTPVAK